MSKMTFDVKSGESLTLIGTGSGDQEEATWELPGGTISEKGAGAASLFWKSWFGKPADGGLEDLKADLLSGKAVE
jgi:hypothetical protein